MEKISRRQLHLIGIAYALDTTMITLPGQVIGSAKMDAWLSYLLAAGLIALSLWFVSRVMNRFPDQDMFGVLIAKLPIVGKLFAMLYILFFFFILIRDIRIITDFANITLLPMTPLMAIGLLVSLTILFIARGGIEILARMTELWLPLLLLGVLTIPIGLLREFDFRFLAPVLDGGFVPPLTGGWYLAAYLGEVIALPFLFSNSTFRFRDGMVALATGSGALLLLHYYALLSLGEHIPGGMLYPTYEMVRQIRVTDFLDRFDLPLVALYMPTMLTKIAYSLYFVCHGLQRIAPSLEAKIVVTPVSVLALVCSFWFFSNSVQIMNLNRTWPVLALLFEFVLPLLLFAWVSFGKGKRLNV